MNIAMATNTKCSYSTAKLIYKHKGPNKTLHQTGRGAAALIATSPGPAGEFNVRLPTASMSRVPNIL